MSEPVIFYTNPMSRGQIVRWMLHEAAVDYEQQLIEYGPAMQAPEYLAVNPMGKVPAIVHGAKVITECSAICAYLADAFPAAGLAPAIDQRADYYRWLFFAAGPIEAATTNQSLGLEASDEQQRMAGYGSLQRTLDAVTAHLAKQTYVCGDQFTAADVYLGSQIIWGTMFGTVPENEVFKAYASRLEQRPAYADAKAVDQALIDATQPKEV